MVRQTREVPGYRPVPILANEDDHFDFEKPGLVCPLNTLNTRKATKRGGGCKVPGRLPGPFSFRVPSCV